MTRSDAAALRCRLQHRDCELSHCSCGNMHHCDLDPNFEACEVDSPPEKDLDVRAAEIAAGWDPNP